MTEEKAPSPLPETLPAGTQILPAPSMAVATLTEPAKHHGGGDYGFVACDTGNWTLNLSGSTSHGRVLWPSYYAALRSPPSPPSEGPKVGETWLIRRPSDSIRRLSAPSADKLEPKPGDEVAGCFVGGGGCSRGGTECVGTFVGWADHNGKRVASIRCKCGSPWVHESSIRLIRPATPSPKAEEATLPPCQHRNVNLYTMRCDDCGMTAAQVRAKAEKVAERVDPPAAKLDPDGRYPHKGFPSAQDLENHAVARDRDIAAIKQHLADFDRPLATVAVGGRFGRRVPLPGRWAMAEDDEP